MSTSVEHVISAWDNKLMDICVRFDRVLEEATLASQPMIAAVDTDLSALNVAWGAIEQRMHQHSEEVSDGWDEISDALGDIDDLPEGIMDREGNKRDATTCEIEIRYARAYRSVMARAAEVMCERALATDAAEHKCTQCGARLTNVVPISQSLDVTCASCRAVNTVNPKQALRMFAASGAMFLGEMAALCDWEAQKRIELQIRQYRNRRDVPLALLSSLAETSRRYWTTRLEVEARYVPEQQPHVAAKLERYMKDTEKELRQYWQWRQRSA